MRISSSSHSAAMCATTLALACGASRPPPAGPAEPSQPDAAQTGAAQPASEAAGAAAEPPQAKDTPDDARTGENVAWEPFHVPLAPLAPCTGGAGAPKLVGAWGSSQVLASEAEFTQLFCAPSQIDWTRHHVVVWVQTRNSPSTTVQNVTVNDGTVLVHWKREHWCHGANYEGELWASAATIPARPRAVESRVQEGPRPDCQGVP